MYRKYLVGWLHFEEDASWFLGLWRDGMEEGELGREAHHRQEISAITLKNLFNVI